jgi:TRAP-type C4-dicarboxylate transport system permease small subunit
MAEPTTVRRVSMFTRALEVVVIGLMALLTLDVLWGVFSRFVVGSQSTWTDELATALVVWVALLGAALAYAEHAHLGVDYLVGKCSPKVQVVIAVLGHVLVIAFAGTVMVYGGAVLVGERLQARQVLPSLGWYKGYIYAAVPISGVFIIGYAIASVVQLLRHGLPGEAAAAETER